jgi:hypothetical protein
MNWIKDIRQGLEQLPRDSKALQRFATVLSSALLLIAALFFFLKRDAGTTLCFAAVIVLLLAAALVRPNLLRPLYVGWMALAFALGAVVSRVILTLFFYAILTPIALALRLFGKDFLHKKLKQERASYWITRPVREEKKEDYQRLF